MTALAEYIEREFNKAHSLLVATFDFDGGYRESVIITDMKGGVLKGLPSIWAASTVSDPIGDTDEGRAKMGLTRDGRLVRAYEASKIRAIEITPLPSYRLNDELREAMLTHYEGTFDIYKALGLSAG